jgi:hypothetical protein
MKKMKIALLLPAYILRCSFCVFGPVSIQISIQRYLLNSY